MLTVDKAIADITRLALGANASPEDQGIFRKALEGLIELAVMTNEYNRVQSMAQVQRAMSDGYNED